MKQIGLAVHNIHDTYNSLPPAVADSAQSRIWRAARPFGKGTTAGPGPFGYTIFHFLLPFFEQKTLWDSLNPNDGNYNGLRYQTVLRTLNCPSDASGGGSSGMCLTANGGANNWGASNYGANWLVFANVTAGHGEGEGNFSSIVDGLSNTVFFAEKYATCGTSGNINAGDTYGSLWADSNTVWRPVICTNARNSTHKSNPTSPGYPAAPGCLMFQGAVNWLTGCNNNAAQSMHPGGMNVLLGDGSVKFATAAMAPATWGILCDPRDGLTVSNDW
jgi:prepilin-type processing-associated H-X9-DG protein